MKKLTSLIIVALTLLSLLSCGSSDHSENPTGDTDGTKMTAEITHIGEKLEVNVIEGEYGASGIYWVIIDETTPIFDADGKAIGLSGLKVRDTIEITYGGQVMMSYPPQIVAKKIVIKP
jgi:hypothetical protein